MQTKRVSKAILYQDNKILLQLRDNKPTIPNPNTWSLLGGQVIPGETPELCIRREVIEEVNLYPYDFKLITVRKRDEDNMEVEEYIFCAKIYVEATDIATTEGQCVRLFSEEEIKELNLNPIYKEIIYSFLEQK
ncbi:MAG: NUDIX hydrolase [uncultured bacterium]|nr:MAG: NUDIX hydrolase [uncultured bacterium]